ncbi:Ser-Thr-rich glycosyl-phosphatidyl-inositol-anchored membrane family-domain-containing protein [Endogone sp. FLAS-F59071]|nr:Ser-Thr-rich glycosyl-phosphatidyl-inositol-anchored membrane family-domain-containing protein [Endogone sp. FLAS-F59071]|eukprot:RUS22561.1 Ser-Thr-rich glycosyl-phosphatidyl-inositol-anchored membrane family-domain-containing protein [Endogone sp. FLAS-F59071]
MKVTIFALLSLVAAAVAQNTTTTYFITSPIAGTSWAAGKKVSITWTGGTSDLVSLLLLNGPTATTESVYNTIAQNVTGSVGTYSWTIPTTLEASTTYAIEITDGTGLIASYSHPFTITSSNGTLSFSSASSVSSVSSYSFVAPSSASLTSSSIVLTATSSPTVSFSSSIASVSATAVTKSGAASYLKPAAIVAAIVPLAAVLLL